MSKKRLVISILTTVTLSVLSIFLLFSLVFSWYTNYTKTSISTGTRVVTPQTFAVGAGKNDDIQNLSMGNIDATDENKCSYYCFSVIGKPATQYLIQLAYTTNIAFTYEIYEAELKYCSVETTYVKYDETTINLPAIASVENPIYTMKYFSTDEKIYYFNAKSKITMNKLNVTNDVANSTYTDKNYGLYNKFQVNSNPVYLQSNECDVSEEEMGMYGAFEHYYILKISWDELINDKEVDQIYLTVTITQ